MDVKAPVVEKEVTDYDFSFVGGPKLVYTVDPSIGDTVSETPDTYVLDLKAKPSVANPEEALLPEEVTIYKHLLAAVNKRRRMQRVPTPEELFDLHETIHAIAKGIQ